jgi:hypothetical protein
LSDSLPRAFKPWLIASVSLLVLSLAVLAISVTAAFVSFQQTGTPLWVVVLGALSVFGILLGFGGMFLLMAIAGVKAFRDGRKVQVLPPEH